jgi:peptidoglycan/xylan/chitin deacetylase (PgdA/CDA1 family)
MTAHDPLVEPQGQDFATRPRPSIGRKALSAAQSAMHLSGLGWMYRRLARARGATILMYHSVPGADVADFVDPANAMPPRRFEEQMAFLARSRRVISMSDLVASIELGESQPAGTVVITFDDGYLDNLTVAAPILARHRLPAILYLATGHVTRRQPQWIDELYGAFRFRTSDTLTLRGSPPQDLRNGDSTSLAYQVACQRLLPASASERRDLLASVSAQLRPSRTPPRLTLGWDDVRRLVAQHPSIEIGVHTADHTDLTSVPIGEAEHQIQDSIERVTAELGRRPTHFSFPYGRQSDELRAVVRAAGLRSAIGAARLATIAGSTDPYALARIEAPRSPARLAFYTSGSHPGLSRLLLRRA